jgi:hypothetical protein
MLGHTGDLPSRWMVPGGATEPPKGFLLQRILSSTVGSAPLGKFSTLLYFSTGYRKRKLNRCDPIRRVLSMELLQFYYSRMVARAEGWIAATLAKSADVAPRTGTANIPVADSAEQPEKIVKIRLVQ